MSAFTPYAEYLPQVDIVYVRLREAEIVRTLNLGHWRNVDLDAHGNVVAVEFIDVTHEGLNMTGVPESDAVVRLIRAAGIPITRSLSA